jgi:hypothetical protein
MSDVVVVELEARDLDDHYCYHMTFLSKPQEKKSDSDVKLPLESLVLGHHHQRPMPPQYRYPTRSANYVPFSIRKSSSTSSLFMTLAVVQ